MLYELNEHPSAQSIRVAQGGGDRGGLSAGRWAWQPHGGTEKPSKPYAKLEKLPKIRNLGYLSTIPAMT